MYKVLIGSPIRRSPKILKAFLDGLDFINYDNIAPTFYFVDDNDDASSRQLLAAFAKSHPNTIIVDAHEFSLGSSTYCEDGIHTWDDSLTNRVAEFKDSIIAFAQKEKYDFLFFLDSDMVVQPETLQHLISRKVDIVSEIFWTDWHRTGVATPSVWLEDENNIVRKKDTLNKDRFYIKRETANFYAKLRVPGIYPVGGLGALTLISRCALNKSISFKTIDNLSFFGEDRHFCVRARALGLNLFVDTVYPAFHIFREDLLKRLPSFIKHGYKEEYILLSGGDEAPNAKTFKSRLTPYYRDTVALYRLVCQKMFRSKRIVSKAPKITLMMLICDNEALYLEQCLAAVKPSLHNAVILDATHDHHATHLCETLLQDIPHQILHNPQTGSINDSALNQQLWRATIATHPDWILRLDANEVLEKDSAKVLQQLATNYATDSYNFIIEGKFVPFMLRYQPAYKYRLTKYSGKFPQNALSFISHCDYPLRVTAQPTPSPKENHE